MKRMRLSIFGYTSGFILALILSIAAYFVATGDRLYGSAALVTLGFLALIQFVVQLVFFLHLGGESRPRLRLLSLLFMGLILLIIVGGSIWIMDHLNYHMMEMDAPEKDSYMNSQRDRGF